MTRTLVMGIVNVTPDSFSDGGRWLSPAAAIDHGRRLIDEGADLLDVGGESTRPGAVRPSSDEELRRVLPVVEGLVRLGARVSVDTMRASVAQVVIERGAVIINDVSGGLADPEMITTVADHPEVDYVVMHWRGHGDHMHTAATYDNVVSEVTSELLARRDAAVAAGIQPERIVLDPGYGFAKTAEHNWQLFAANASFTRHGHRLLVGVSRKRFLGELLSNRARPDSPTDRDAATLALTTLCAHQGVWAVRTHEVAQQRDACEVVARLHCDKA